MRRLLGLALLASALTGATPAAAADPVRDDAATVRDGDVRFQVISPTLVRLEHSPSGAFEDRPTMTAPDRRIRPPRFRARVSGADLVIATDRMTLRYRRGSGTFGPANVAVRIRDEGTLVRPDWSGDDDESLGGWARGLDEVSGPVPLRPGILSRRGWHLVDDTATVLLTRKAPGFEVRPARDEAYQDGYLFAYGSDFRTALRDLRALTGAAPLLPRQAFGVWFSRYWPLGERDFRETADRFRAEGVPLDVLVVDTDFRRQNDPVGASIASTVARGDPSLPYSWNGWDWNRDLYPDPVRFFAWARDEGLATSLNVHPSIVRSDPLWDETDLRAGGLLREGCPIQVADPGPCGLFDWANPRHIEAYFALHEPFEREGMDFWWFDWCCDESRAVAPGLTADTWINMLYAARSEARGSRWPAFSRIGDSHQGGDGGAPGALVEHRHAIHFTGDACATWEMLAFQSELTAAQASIGLPYTTHDIGSFNGEPVAGICNGITGTRRGRIPEEMYVRWVQFGTFQPILRLHSNHGQRLPWEYGEAANRAAAESLRLRGRLLPHLYTLAREAHDTGLPMARPLYLHWPGEKEAYRRPTQYTLGKDILVAPVVTPGDPAHVEVWLPPGDWVDLFTGERHRGDSVRTFEAPLDRMLAFARAGSLVVTQPDSPRPSRGTPETLVVTAHSGRGGRLRHYEDEGDGLDHRRGRFARTPIVHREARRASSVRIGPTRGRFPGRAARRSYEVRFAGSRPPRSVTVNGRRVRRTSPGTRRGWWYDEASRAVVVRTGPVRTSRAVTVRRRAG